jgi:uncharacterized protein YecT (DUF1311 family)
MIDKIFTAILAALLVSPGTSVSQPADNQMAQGIQCNENGTTAEMKACAERDYKIADRKLNQVYRQLIAEVSGEEKQRLIAAERAWIGFRDASCKFEAAQALGGTLEGLLFTGCLAEMTGDRTSDLEKYLAQSQEKPQTGRITNIVQGDIMCYVTLRDDANQEYNLGATFDICAQSDRLLNRTVSLEYGVETVNDCQSNEPCGKTREELIITGVEMIN